MPRHGGVVMSKILVLYYSMYGHIELMSQAVAEGVRAAGSEATIKRVPETIPEAKAKELGDYDGILFGGPTRYGVMAAQLRNFIDQTGKLWLSGALIGKPGGVFTSTATQHGGQETTITSFHTTLLHLGMGIVGLPYSAKEQMRLDEITGGSPYGASTISGGAGSRMPSENELGLARFQGQHLARIAAKLAAR